MCWLNPTASYPSTPHSPESATLLDPHVEALARLLADPASIDQLPKIRGRVEHGPFSLIVGRGQGVLDHGKEHVYPDDIKRPEGGAVGAAHGQSGDAVHLVGPEAGLVHGLQREHQ